MGLFDRVNKLWSGADFWQGDENRRQREQFAQEERDRKKREAEARRQAQINRNPAPQQTPGTVFQPSSTSAVSTLQDPKKANEDFAKKQSEEKRVVDNAYQAIVRSNGQSGAPFSSQTLEKVNNRAKQEQERIKNIKSRNASVFDKISSFANTGADKLAGGFGRGIFRGVDYLVPGVDTLGTQNLRKLADEWDTRAQASRAKAPDPKLADAGATFGSTVKGIGDVGLMVAPSIAASNAAKASNIYQRAMQGSKFMRTGAQVAENVVTGLPASGMDLLQEAGRGNDPSIARSVGAGAAVDAAIPFLGTGVRAISRLTGLDLVDDVARNADNAISPGSPGSVVDAPPTPSTTGKVELAPGIKVDAPEPVVPPVRPEVPVDLPPVRPEVQAIPTFGEIVQPEPLVKAPVQQQPIPEITEQIAPPVQPVREAAEQVQKSIDEQPLPKPEVMTAQKTPQAIQAEAEIAQNPQIVPVDNQGMPVRAVDDAVATPPSKNAIADGAEVTVDAPAPKAPVESKATKGFTSQSDLPDATSEGLVKTGKKGKSKGKTARGQEYDKVGVKETEAQAAVDAANTSYRGVLETIDEDGVITARTAQTAAKLAETMPAGAEKNALLSIANKSKTQAAQVMRLARTKMRRLSSVKELKTKFETQLNMKSKGDLSMGKADYDILDEVNNNFVKARDSYDSKLRQFNDNPSAANEKAFFEAHDEMVVNDVKAKFEEYKIVQRLSKKSKNPEIKDFVKAKEEEAGVYMMDAVDSSFLSSTRTMLNNYLNTGGVRLEETLFGKVGARLAERRTGLVIGGGGDRASRKLGAKLGDTNLKRDAGLRTKAQGNKGWNKYKNIVTTGNTAGERNIESSIFGSLSDHYEQTLKKSGYSGAELKRRSRVMALADPENARIGYENDILTANALSSVTSGFKGKIENTLTSNLSKVLPDNKVSKTISKAIVRATVGFPTVIARSLKEGGKRTLLGTPSYVTFRRAMAAGDKQAATQAYKAFVKEAGSGATMIGMGAGLSAAGLITGSYPTDPDERARWEREGITENSIKIGDHYWQLPPLLGSLALPFMVGANIDQQGFRGEGNPAERAIDVSMGAIKSAIDTSPADSIIKNAGFIEDLASGRDVSKYLAQTTAGVTKALIPASSFFNSIGKMFDSTKNETNDGDFAEMFLDKVFDGIPGGQKIAAQLGHSLEDKDVDGQTISNPNPIARLFGAVSKVQGEGVEKTQNIEAQIDESVSKLNEYGAFSDNVRNLLDDEKKSLLDKAKNGKKLDESDIKGLMSDMVRGVTDTGNTQFLEKEQYDDNLAVLRVKRDIISADPTTTQATIDKYDTQITRGEIYQKNKTPYSLITDYKDIGLEDWRKIGAPPGSKYYDEEYYDPELYQRLWDLDQEMTEAGVSRGKKGKNKYYEKETSSGSGSGSGKAKLRSSSTRQLSLDSLRSNSTNQNKYVAIDKPKSYIPDLQSENKAKTDLKKSIKVQKGVQL